MNAGLFFAPQPDISILFPSLQWRRGEMDYQETLDFMYSQLPMYQRLGRPAFKPDLKRTVDFMEALAQPHQKFLSIHIAGTNGKGSVAHMLASVFQEAGYKTGLYTSPHLKSFRERIKINGQCISEEAVVRFISENKDTIHQLKPSFFEMTVAMAFHYFATQYVDVAIVEVGMGGRLDSTNVIHPELSVITNISFDHTGFLGDSLDKIAFEKAGIIKEQVPVVIGKTQPETAPVFMEKAWTLKSDVVFADELYKVLVVKKLRNGFQRFDIMNYDKGELIENIEVPLPGNYQKENILTVFAAWQALQDKFPRIRHALKSGVRNTFKNTKLRGRWEVLGYDPLVVADTAHNEAGLRCVMQQVNETPKAELHMVISMVNDKDVDQLLTLMPKDAFYYFCKADIPRGLDASILAFKATAHSLQSSVFPSVKQAFAAALRAASPSDMIFVGGSTFTVAEVI